MLRYLGRRLFHSIFVLIGVSIVVFALLRLAPGDPVEMMLGDNATPEQVAVIRAKYGLDKPLVTQYFIWFSRVARGDLGDSFYYQRTNWSLILDRLPPSAELAFYATMLSLIVAIPLGLIAGVKKGSVVDMIAMVFALLGQALSPVWIGLVLILVVCVGWGALPAFGYGNWQNAILPSITLGLPLCALVTRLLRSNMIDVLSEDHITATSAKGVPPLKIYTRYGFKNASIPVITVTGIRLAGFIGGAVTTEKIFNWPGLGTLTVQAINLRDFTLVQAILLVTSAILVFVNLATDLLYVAVDPRLSFDTMG